MATKEVEFDIDEFDDDEIVDYLIRRIKRKTFSKTLFSELKDAVINNTLNDSFTITEEKWKDEI